MPNSNRNPNEEFIQSRLPNSRRWDLDQIAEPHPQGYVGHMLPSPSTFAQACTNLGINNDDHLLFYDTLGLFSSPRAAFTFKVFGHKNISILDGGLPAYVKENLPLESGPVQQPPKSDYSLPTFDTKSVKDHVDIINAINDKNNVILDARPTPRFTGEAPEPRPNLSSGHMPNAHSLPFVQLIDQSTGTLKNIDELRHIFENALGKDLFQQVLNGDKHVINSCGSGMTAAIIWLALDILNVRNNAIYDESWTGYASRSNSPIVKN